MSFRLKFRAPLKGLRLRAAFGLARRFGRHLRDQRWRLGAAALCAVGVAGVELLRPWPLKLIFDGVLLQAYDAGGTVAAIKGWLGSEDALLTAAALAMLVIAVLGGLLNYGQSYLLARAGQKLTARVRTQLFSHVQRLSPAWHDRRDLGDLLTRLSGDVQLLRDLLVNSATFLLGRSLVVVSVLAVMVAMDWRLALVALSVAPLLLLGSFRFGREIREAARKQRRREGQLAQVVAERVAAVRLVQAFAREDYEDERFEERNASSARAGLKATRMEANLDRLVQIVLAVGTCGVIWYGVTRVRAGALTPGDLLVFAAYLKSFYRPAQKLASLTGRSAKAIVAGERITSILDIEPEIRDALDAIKAPPFRGDIRFDGVGFAYGAEGPPVFRDLNLSLRQGETVAIVGESGTGKSTLANLLLRFYDPTAGAIRVDGIDIRGLTLESLRRQIATVMQEAVLFAASIRENIAYGRLDATMEEIEAAARAAGAHDFIMALPDGYDTVVGERGATLSGGQRQRVAIARALVRQAPIVVLDEPTTGLDAESATALLDALAALLKDRTCLLITHDPRVLALAHHVYRLTDGRLERDEPIRHPAAAVPA